MEQIAIISDIHSNLPALETVLADIDVRGIDTIYCLGDLVGKGPDSIEVIDICQEVCADMVMGNWDADIVSLNLDTLIDKGWDRTGHLAWQRRLLGTERLAYLEELPNTIELLLSGKRVRLFHASQQSVHRRVLFNDEPFKLRSMFENTAFTGFDRPEPDIVGYGDIHHPYMLPVEDRTLFNVGSVGNPMDYIPMAGYAILKGLLGSATPSPLSIEIVRLPYSINAAIERARAVDMPALTEYEFELRTANHRSQMPRR